MQNKTQTNNKTTNGDGKMEKMIEIVYEVAKEIYKSTDEPSNIGDNYKDIFIEYAQEFYPEENEYALWNMCINKIIPEYAEDKDIKKACEETLNSVLLILNNEMIRIQEKSSYMEESFESRNIWNDEIESFVYEFLNKCKLNEPYSNESIGYVQGVIYSYLIDFLRGE